MFSLGSEILANVIWVENMKRGERKGEMERKIKREKREN
jgi:hypothetical protein